MIRFGAAQRPLRTGRCRVRELRCSFTIATFSRNEIRAASDLAVFRPAIPAGLPLASRTGLRIVGDGALAGRAFARFDDNYKRMNELSKDAVSWLTVDENATGQRIDNFLLRILKGVPKSHVYRILRSGEVRVNKGRVGPDVRLTVGDVVRVPPVRTAAPPRAPIARIVQAGDSVRGRMADRRRQAGGPRGAWRQRHRTRADRAIARRATGCAIPRARAPARPRYFRRTARRQEACGADRSARAAPRR